MVCGFGLTRVTVAVAVPPGPVALTVTEGDEGMAEGAVYKPEVEMLPALADQLVAPEDVNCCVAPSRTEAVAGEIV